LNSKTSNNNIKLIAATLAISIAKLAIATFALNITRLVAIAFAIALVAAHFKLAHSIAYKSSRGSAANSAT
jgi:hypothetical protein